MRILTLTSLYPNPLQPHLANHNRQQIRHLASRHDVSVIAPVAWTVELAARWRGRKLPPGRRTVLDGIPVEHPRYLFPPKILRGWYGKFFRWSVRSAFARAVADFRPDVVYTPWAYPDGWSAVELGRAAGLPVVVQVMGSDLLLLSEWPARRRATLDALHQADAVVAVSRDLVNRLVKEGVALEKIHLVYRGVDSARFSPAPRDEALARLGLPPARPLLLFVGNLEPVKGLDVLLESCRRLVAEGVPFTCLVAGQGTLRSQLEDQVRRLGLGERVRFLGAIPNDRLPDWYRAATVFVLPSRSEGVPNVLLEAAACGVPFVASRVGGIPEIAHLGQSRLVTPGDAGALAEALAAFLRGEGPRSLVAPVPRSWEQSAAELIRVFEEASRVRGPAPATTPDRPQDRDTGTRNSPCPC